MAQRVSFIFPSISTVAENANGNRRKRRADGDDPDPVSTPVPTLTSFSDDDSTDDSNNNEEDEDEDEDDDFLWDDADSEEFQDPSKKDPSFLKSEQMAVLMAREDAKVLRTLGHQFEDMVLSCTYRGVSCR